MARAFPYQEARKQMTRGLRTLAKKEQVWLAIIFLYYAMINIVWLTADKVPPYFDQSRYLLRSFQFAEDIYLRDLSGFLHHATSWSPHPPLLPLLAVPFHLVLGISFDSARLVSVPLILTLIISTYTLSFHLTRNKMSSLLASFITPSIPLIGTFSRYFYIDFLLVVVVVTSICLLLRSDRFHLRKYTLLFGASLVVGLLTKELFWLFLLPPTAYVVLSRVRQSGLLRERLFHRPRALVFAVVAGGAFSLLLLRFLIISMPFIRGALQEAFGDLVRGRYSVRAWIDFHNDFIGFGISYFYLFVLIGLGIAYLLSRTSKGRTNDGRWWILGLWFLIPYLFLSVSWDRDYRYALSLMPVIGIAIAVCTGAIANRCLRYAIVSIIVVGGSVQFYAQAFGIGALPTRVVVNVPILDHVILFDQGYFGGPEAVCWDFFLRDRFFEDGDWWRTHFSYVAYPDPSHWPIAEIIAYIATDAEEAMGDAPPTIYVVPSYPYFNSFNFEAQRRVTGISAYIWPYRREKNLEEKLSDVTSSDYLVTKSGLQAWTPTWLLPYTDQMLELLDEGNLPFQRMEGTFALPDGSIATVWRRE